MSDSKGYHLRPDVIEIHRAIGGYITTYSELVAAMRYGIHQFLSPPDTDEWHHPPNPLLDILFNQMTADPIRAAYFAISSHVGDLNDADRTVRNALQGLVQYYTSLRNDIAHADWSVGWALADSDEPVLPTAHKIKVSKDGISNIQLALTAEKIGKEINHLGMLTSLIRTWAEACRRRQQGDKSRRPSDLLEVYASPTVGKAVRLRPAASSSSAPPEPPRKPR
jgi:hypothetical protein